MNEASGIMKLLVAHGGTDLQANDPAYLNFLLQQVLEAQKVDHDERDKPWKLTHRWWLQYLAGIIGVSVFGASITFGVLTTSSNASSVETSNHTSGTGNEPGTQDSNGTHSSPRFDEGTVRIFLAVTFLLFLLVIAFGNLMLYLLLFHENKCFTEEGFYKIVFHIKFNNLLHSCNLLITTLMLAAFIMISLVIVAYAEVVGWIILYFVFLYWLIYVLLWYNQLDLGSSQTQPRLEE